MPVLDSPSESGNRSQMDILDSPSESGNPSQMPALDSLSKGDKLYFNDRAGKLFYNRRARRMRQREAERQELPVALDEIKAPEHLRPDQHQGPRQSYRERKYGDEQDDSGLTPSRGRNHSLSNDPESKSSRRQQHLQKLLNSANGSRPGEAQAALETRDQSTSQGSRNARHHLAQGRLDNETRQGFSWGRLNLRQESDPIQEAGYDNDFADQDSKDRANLLRHGQHTKDNGYAWGYLNRRTDDDYSGHTTDESSFSTLDSEPSSQIKTKLSERVPIEKTISSRPPPREKPQIRYSPSDPRLKIMLVAANGPEENDVSRPKHKRYRSLMYDTSTSWRERTDGFSSHQQDDDFERQFESQPQQFETRSRQKDLKSHRQGRYIRYKDSMDDDEMFDEETEDRKPKRKNRERAFETPTAQPVPIELPQFISISNLASSLRVPPEDFIRKLEQLGFEDIAMDHVLSAENAGLVAMEYNYEPVADLGGVEDIRSSPPAEDRSLLPERPPIVTIMGHVDHGKTTLLDYLRKSSVAASEFGGITQRIGAFSVKMSSDRPVTFLDTPGHAAFLAMRQRGANVTDIVVLVVAADDSVKPQTIEAIKHAKSAGVNVIVAITKVDKDEADVQRVKQDLTRHEIEVEDYGGDIQAVEVSGKTGQGMAELDESIVALADVLDLRAEEDGSAEGWIIEATTKKAGRTATVLVRRGTLRTGNTIVAGTTWARVRSLRNEAGANVKQAGPGIAVEVDGWRDQPSAGDEVLQAPDERKATSVVEYRKKRVEQIQAGADMEAINQSRRLEAERRAHEREIEQESAESLSEAINGGDKSLSEENATSQSTANVSFIVKADVTGSAEAVVAALEAIPLGTDTGITMSIIYSGVGLVSESDITRAMAIQQTATVSKSAQSQAGNSAYIIAFNTDVPSSLQQTAAQHQISIVKERIIYRVIEEARNALESYLPPIISRRVLGEAEAAAAFDVRGRNKITMRVAGCRVRNGIVSKSAKLAVYRGGVAEGHVVFEGSLSSLRSRDKDVSEMHKGTECGMIFENGWTDFEVGDVIQFFEETRERRKLPS